MSTVTHDTTVCAWDVARPKGAFKAIDFGNLTFEGRTNTTQETYLAHLQSAIRRPVQQLRSQGLIADRVCLLGGGPSINDTLPELVDLIHDGAKLVTMNGSYHWALDHHLHPKTQVVIDARSLNKRFVEPDIPTCNYLIASICHPDLWDLVQDRPRTWMFHPVTPSDDDDMRQFCRVLDEYYLAPDTWGPSWMPCGGGTTVASRALVALRSIGYLRFDLFGIDCCWRGDQHHAYAQPENDHDNQYEVVIHPGTPHARTFYCAGWHLKQLEDFMTIIKVNGHHFAMNIHGDGLLAYVINTCAEMGDIVVRRDE